MSQKLCRAAARGSVKRIEELLRDGEDVNWVDGGLDPDEVAGWLNAYEEVGFDYVPKTGIGKTPILFAAANGHTKAALLLLEHGADANAADSLGRSALMFAIDRTDQELCRALIEHGADVNAVDATGEPVLSWAAESGSVPLVELLVEAGAEINPDVPEERAPITTAGQMSNEELMNWLLDRGAHPLPQAVRSAFLKGYLSTVERLIARGLDVNEPLANGELPIANFKGEKMLDLLLEHGADPSKCDGCVLWAGNEPSDADKLRKLVTAGADINAPINDDGETYLMRQAHWDSDGTMTRLALELGARTDLFDDLGDTALDHAKDRFGNGNPATVALIEEHTPAETIATERRRRFPARVFVEAARQGDIEEVCSMLDDGIDIDVVSPVHHNTALADACRQGHLELVRELLRRGASVHAFENLQPLSEAAGSGHLEIVNLLLDHAADVNARGDGVGYTALMMAAGSAHLEVCRQLIAAGADLDVESAFQDTPLNRARDHEWRKECYNPCVDLLLEAGATNYAGSKLEHQPPRPDRPS